MTLRLCPDCENFHRGRAMVCRPCARERLRVHMLGLYDDISRETNDNNPDELLREIADIMGEKA